MTLFKKKKANKNSPKGNESLSPSAEKMFDLVSKAKAQKGEKTKPSRIVVPNRLTKDKLPDEMTFYKMTKTLPDGTVQHFSMEPVESTLDLKTDKDLINSYKSFFDRADEIVEELTKPSNANLAYVLCIDDASGMPYVQIKAQQTRKDGTLAEVLLKPNSKLFSTASALEKRIHYFWKTLLSMSSDKELSLNEYTAFYRIWNPLLQLTLETKKAHLEHYHSLQLRTDIERSAKLTWVISHSQVRLNLVIEGEKGTGIQLLNSDVPMYLNPNTGSLGFYGSPFPVGPGLTKMFQNLPGIPLATFTEIMPLLEDAAKSSELVLPSTEDVLSTLHSMGVSCLAGDIEEEMQSKHPQEDNGNILIAFRAFFQKVEQTNMQWKKPHTPDLYYQLQALPNQLPTLHIKNVSEPKQESERVFRQLAEGSIAEQEFLLLWQKRPQFSPANMSQADYLTYTQYLQVLINSCEETNRFCIEPSLPLRLGAIRTAKFSWVETSNSTKPSLSMPTKSDKSAKFLDSEIPMYLEPEKAEISLVNIPLLLGPGLMGLFKKIPAIDQKRKYKIPDLLQEVGMLGKFPLPSGLEHVSCMPAGTIAELNVLNSNSGPQKALQVKFAKPLQRAYLEKSSKALVYFTVTEEVTKPCLQEFEHLGFQVDGDPVETRTRINYQMRPSSEESWSNLSEDTLNRLEQKYPNLISAETRQKLRPFKIEDEHFYFDVNESNGWFAMAVKVKLGDEYLPLLPIMRRAISRIPDFSDSSLEILNAKGLFSAVLDDGRLIQMPFGRIKTILLALKEVLSLTEQNNEGDALLSSCDLIQLLELQKDKRNEFCIAESAQKIFTIFQGLKRPPRVPPPVELTTPLKAHQMDPFCWMQCISTNEVGGILADDMGLGKTAVTIANILANKLQKPTDGPVLIVCPSSIVESAWGKNLQQFAPSPLLKAHYHLSSDRHMHVHKMLEADVVITTYKLMVLDLEILKSINWRAIYLDEAHQIKNSDTETAKAAKSLSSKYRFAITGTPIENSMMDLWSIIDFLLPGFFGNASSFRRAIKRLVAGDDPERLARLRTVMKPFYIRRLTQTTLNNLPEKTEIIEYVDLEDDQTDLYEVVRLSLHKELLQDIANKGFNRIRGSIFMLLIRLRQVCIHPPLSKLEAAANVHGSAKLRRLLEIVPALVEEGRRILIFSQFVQMLNVIGEKLDDVGIGYLTFTGEIQTQKRSERVDRFQRGDVPIMLCGLQACGQGLTLTKADTVILYEPFWNPAKEDQAIGRAHRIGQENNVTVIRLIARGTIEEKIRILQENKKLLADSVFGDENDEDDNKISSSLTEEDVRFLLS